MRIELKKDNVVKSVDSEDKAKALEAKGFLRTDGKTIRTTADAVAIEAARKRCSELEKELTDTKEKLEEASKYAEEADRKIDALNQELVGTKEQLEAAVKKNRATDRK